VLHNDDGRERARPPDSALEMWRDSAFDGECSNSVCGRPVGPTAGGGRRIVPMGKEMDTRFVDMRADDHMRKE
jgi:hypothetical protein